MNPYTFGSFFLALAARIRKYKYDLTSTSLWFSQMQPLYTLRQTGIWGAAVLIEWSAVQVVKICKLKQSETFSRRLLPPELIIKNQQKNVYRYALCRNSTNQSVLHFNLFRIVLPNIYFCKTLWKDLTPKVFPVQVCAQGIQTHVLQIWS